MIDLITPEMAKIHHRILDSDHDIDVAFKVTQASAIVMRHLKLDAVPDDWIANSSPITYDIPADVLSLVYVAFSELYENRESGVSNVLSRAFIDLASQRRDPTMA